MDVIFWNSPPEENLFFIRYIGPYKLAHWLRKHQYTCQVIDFILKLSEEELYTHTKKFITSDTVILGISTTFLALGLYNHSDGSTSVFPEHLFRVIRKLKLEHPKLKIVTGGYMSDHLHMGGLPDATIMSYTNAVEDIFLEYLQHFKCNTPLPMGRILSSYTSVNTGSVKIRMLYDTARNPTYSIETDDFMWDDQDGILPNEALPLDISRGCIFNCKFCQYPHLGKSKHDYIRDMELIKKELISNYNRFGVTNYMILDDTFNDTELKVQAFHDMVVSLPFKINYSAYLRADLIHRFPKTAQLLKDSGLWGAFFGIESFHPASSKLIGKGWSGKSARDYLPTLIHEIWNSEIPVTLSFIVGLPEETEDDLLDTVQWINNNNIHCAVFHNLGVVDPAANRRYSVFSEFDRNAEKYGFKFNNGKWYHNIWSEDKAREVAAALNKSVYNKASSWHLGNLLALGYEKNHLLESTIKNLGIDNIRQLNKKRYNDYFSIILNNK